MNNIENYLLSCSLMGLESVIKFATMEASDEKSSFLCFLPESQCAPANALFVNGIAEIIDTQTDSGTVVPMSLENRRCFHGTLDPAHGFSDASVEDDHQSSNGHLGDNGTNVAVGLELQNLEIRESKEQVADISGQDALSDGSSGEVDVKAFEITEFFNLFREGQDRNFFKRKQMRDLLPPETLAELEGTGSNASMLDQHTKSNKIVLRVGVNPAEGRMSPNAGRLGMWNCFSEPDSFSATLSGPLTFSGPMSFSGNSGRVPYSGSVSHRSDSSTGSSHSFAFPILPYEWNSSPVRMSKPEKGLAQRSWKWRICSICCCVNSFK